MTAAADGVQVEISLPQDPGQAGKVQARDLVSALAGYIVHASPETGDKVTRAEPIAAQAAAGNVRLVRGDWNEAFLDELTNFPAGSHKDQVDALSGAFARLLQGGAAIFGSPLADVLCEPFSIPAHWPRMFALDLDWQRVTALWAAFEPEGNTLYLYNEYRAPRVELALHADAILSRGKLIQGFIDPTAHGRSREEGMRLIEQLVDRHLDLLAFEFSTEAGIAEVATLLASSRLRVFNTLIGFASEFPFYRRDEKGKPNGDACPLMACTTMLALAAPQFAAYPPEAPHEGDWAQESRSSVTGY
jgi:predicted phage terminase large subunit-like protein